MLIYITWNVYNNDAFATTHLSKVHLLETPVDRAPNHRRATIQLNGLKTLCGIKIGILTSPRRVASWLGRPCLKCKAIRSGKDSESTSSHNARTKSQPTAQQHSDVLPSESDR